MPEKLNIFPKPYNPKASTLNPKRPKPQTLNPASAPSSPRRRWTPALWRATQDLAPKAPPAPAPPPKHKKGVGFWGLIGLESYCFWFRVLGLIGFEL